MQGEASVELDGYTYYNFNRRSTHVNALKGSGEVGIFVRNKLFSTFDISILDKTYDGILGISLISKNTDYSLAVFATYLSPESSTWGRDASGFYAHLLGQIYMHSDYDAMMVCGNMNARLVNLVNQFMVLMRYPKELF